MKNFITAIFMLVNSVILLGLYYALGFEATVIGGLVWLISKVDMMNFEQS